MVDLEAPWLKLSLRVLGYVADTIAVLTFIFHATLKQPTPAWAVLVFILGVILLFKGQSLRGDFIIKRREIYVDIKRWDDSTGAPKDESTTYRADYIKCRKMKARFLVYQDYSSSGHRKSVDVISHPWTSKPNVLHGTSVNLEIDLGTNCSYGKKYQVYSRCEYTDTFPNAQTEDYIVQISYPTKILKIAIFLPPNKSCRDASVIEEVGAVITTQDFLPTISENRRVICWEKKNPVFSAKYKITWNW